MADICTLLFVNIIRINKVDAAVVVNSCLNFFLNILMCAQIDAIFY